MADVLCTTTDAIRAAIGVSANEIKDPQILDLGVEDQLVVYLSEVYPTYQALIDAQSGTPTDQQIADFRKLKLLCQYAGAYIVSLANQNLLYQSLQSGGTTIQRFAKDDIDTLLERLAAARDSYLSSLTGVDPTVALSYKPLITATPDYDPVRGC